MLFCTKCTTCTICTMVQYITQETQKAYKSSDLQAFCVLVVLLIVRGYHNNILSSCKRGNL